MRPRQPLDGPVIRDLAEASTPGIAKLDASWAASVIAGYSDDAAELREFLVMVGLLADTAPIRFGVQS